MFLLVALVLLLLLPSPWNLVGFGVCLALFLGELFFWNRTVRHRRVQAGAETLIGETAIVTAACRPDGQVHPSGGDVGGALRRGCRPGRPSRRRAA